jgi:hypothetical protein
VINKENFGLALIAFLFTWSRCWLLRNNYLDDKALVLALDNYHLADLEELDNYHLYL